MVKGELASEISLRTRTPHWRCAYELILEQRHSLRISSERVHLSLFLL